MKLLGWAIAIVFLAGVLVAGCFAVVHDDDSLGRAPAFVTVAYHGDGDCWDQDDCDGGNQRYDQNYGSRDDRNRNRHRNRGAFSPGPFDRSPVDVHDNCVSLDCSGGDGKRKDQPPARPASLIPPSPGAVRDFVLSTIKAGIELGRLFADTTITFVSNLLVGIA